MAAAKKLELPNLTEHINDWSCRSDKGKDPVVLVHGTFGFTSHADQKPIDRWGRMAEPLKKDGHCVYALRYGVGFLDTPGTGKMADSARELQTFVDGVKQSAGASKVKLVGYSQGGLVSRYYLKNLGGAASVSSLVGLGTPNQGTEGLEAKVGSVVYPAVREMLPNSDFLKQLNNGGDLVSGVSYTMVATPADDIVLPYTSAHLSGPKEQLTNVTLSGGKPVNHDQLPNDPDTIAWVRAAVSATGPADPSFRPGDSLPAQPGNGSSPAPGNSSSPAPGNSSSPAPDNSGKPNPGEGNSTAPGTGGGSGGGDQNVPGMDVPMASPTALIGATSVFLAGGALVYLGNRRRQARS
ncbi:alpha/beta fold hydrolase [Streptomyces pathocidini]|uniref:alpha/beta fold hydrolase n=1 Tax=Streptomyces pathocidini TaxID=1650571 RepID=UPI0033CAC45A